jgi:hypothetical protein
MIIWGSKAKEEEIPGGVFYCPVCQADSPFQRIRVSRYFTLYFIPLFPTSTLGEYIRCGSCRGEMRPEVLALTRETVKRLSEPWTCASCGNKNPPSEQSCLGCKARRTSSPPPLPGTAIAADVPGAGSEGSRPLLVSQAPPAKRSNLALWITLGVIGVVMIPMLPVIFREVSGDSATKIPGSRELRTAESAIGTARDGNAKGNTPEAIKLAAMLAEGLSEARKILFSGSDTKGTDVLTGEYVVYCQLNEDSCAFLVHVPALRHYASDAANAMSDAAYLIAGKALDSANSHPLRLAVATRGAVIYDSVRIGSYVPNSPKHLDGAKEVASKVSTVPELREFFAPAAANTTEPPLEK